jgi:tRNA(Ile)-lysidine synthase
VSAAARASRGSFGPQWLHARLAQLLPGFPRLSLCVAFSGGADSTALLAALAPLARPPLKVRALHVDHGLHRDSRAWSRHCRAVARELGVPLGVRAVAVERRRGESLEAAARAARYRALRAALRPGEALLTAHHEDDQLETVLLQLLRGAGVAGLAAMPAVAPFGGGVLVRPLLTVPHAQLLQWLKGRGLSWIEDDSNAQLHLNRNYLRARVLPLIRARWPAAAATAARSARHAAEAQRLLDALGAADVARASVGTMLSAKVLRTLPPERRRNALRFWIVAAGELPPPTSLLQELAGPLLAARPDSHPRVAWEQVLVQRQADLLSLRTRPGTVDTAPRGHPQLPETRWPWRECASCVLPPPFGTLCVRADSRGPLDLDALASPLIVRSRRGGERLRPLRGGPRRALKSLLQEARIPLAQRAHLPLIFAGDVLVAVAGLWLDESVQATAASPRRGRLSWSATE